MTYTPTNRPVPSDAPEDLYFNSSLLDQYANGEGEQVADRNGVPRLTLAGMEAQFNAIASASAYTWIGDYAADLTFTRRNQFTIRSGQMYRPADSTLLPLTLTGDWATDQAKLDLLENSSPVINAANFGVTGVGDDTAAFNSACTAAAAQGKSVWIPFSTVSIGASSDARGCVVFGGGTVVDGMIRNHTGLVGITVRGFRQDDLRSFLPETADKSPAIVYRQNADKYFVMTRKNGHRGGAVITELLKGLTTPNNSLGGPAELLRCGRTHNCTAVYAWRGTPTATTGTWAAYTVPASSLGHGSDNLQRAVTIQTSSTAGATISFAVDAPRHGRLNVGIYGTPASPASVEILVDGVVVKTVAPPSWANRLYGVPMEVAPGARTIQVRGVGSGNLYVAGINFHRIEEIDPAFTYDNWASYRDAALTHYVLSEGAHDYAIYDFTSKLWGGSYHGGETNPSGASLMSAGKPVTLIDGQLLSVQEFYLRQETLIDWTGVGGGKLATQSLISFSDGQVELKASFRAADSTVPVLARFHTGMHGVNEAFSKLVFPRTLDIGADEVRVGQSSKIIMRHAASDAVSITDYNLHCEAESDRGGAYIEPAAGAYNKIYYPWVQNGMRQFTELAFTCRRTFK